MSEPTNFRPYYEGLDYPSGDTGEGYDPNTHSTTPDDTAVFLAGEAGIPEGADASGLRSLRYLGGVPVSEQVEQ